MVIFPRHFGVPYCQGAFRDGAPRKEVQHFGHACRTSLWCSATTLCPQAKMFARAARIPPFGRASSNQVHRVLWQICRCEAPLTDSEPLEPPAALFQDIWTSRVRTKDQTAA